MLAVDNHPCCDIHIADGIDSVPLLCDIYRYVEPSARKPSVFQPASLWSARNPFLMKPSSLWSVSSILFSISNLLTLSTYCHFNRYDLQQFLQQDLFLVCVCHCLKCFNNRRDILRMISFISCSRVLSDLCQPWESPLWWWICWCFHCDFPNSFPSSIEWSSAIRSEFGNQISSQFNDRKLTSDLTSSVSSLIEIVTKLSEVGS